MSLLRILISITLLPCFLFIAPPIMAASFSDNFTAANGTTLHEHNNLWDCNFNTEAVIENNRAVSSGPNTQNCLANSFQNGSVSTLVNFSGSSSQYSSYVVLRYQNSNNYYFCNINANDGFVIFKVFQGNTIVLDNASGSVGSGDHTLQCSITGSTITLTVDGIQRSQVNDTDITLSGRGGIQITPNSTVDNYISIDNDAPIVTPTVTPQPTPTDSPTDSFSDTFTDINGTTLQAHNSLWDCNFNSEAIIDSNKAITLGATSQICLANSFHNGSASTEVYFPNASSQTSSAVFLRYANSSNYYQCNLNAGDGYVIFKNHQGQFTILQNVAGTPGAGTHTILCTVEDNVITLTVDGVQRAQATDNDLSGIGRAGIQLTPNTTIDDYNSINSALPNNPPSINSISNKTLNEGDAYFAAGSFSDSDSSSWTATVNYGDGSGTQVLPLSGLSFSLNHVYKNNGTFNLTVSVKDNQGKISIEQAVITINNLPAAISNITSSTSPIEVGTAVTASASFDDPGVLDTHTATWNWGDGSTTVAIVNESNGSGTVTNTHSYSAAGVYTITLTIVDNASAAGTSIFQYVTVYSQSAGWASGGKEFISPVGAVISNPTATGKVDFGFQVKYSNGEMVPSGKNVSLSFPTGNINFTSTSYLWLVVEGTKATFKANGTLNGIPGYSILVSAIDQSLTHENGLIRIQIKDANNNVVYDTQPNATDTSNPTTVITKGKIDIH